MSRFTQLFILSLTIGSFGFAAQADAGCGGGGYGGGSCSSRVVRYNRGPVYRPAPPAPVIQQRVPQQQFQVPPRRLAELQQTRRPVQQAPGQQAAPQQAPLQQAGFQQAAPQRPATQQQPQQAAPNALNALGGGSQPSAPAASAEQTALQLLSDMTTPESQPAPQAQPATQASTGPVGVWVAKVNNQATVQLNLRADGAFTWTATRNGQSSNFEGSYSVEGGSLTLTRADGQKLAGAISSISNGFNFKLNGAQDNGLNFARS